MHKTKEYESYLPVLEMIPKCFTISHVKVYQDDEIGSVYLTVLERMNIEIDKIATRYADPPINI